MRLEQNAKWFNCLAEQYVDNATFDTFVLDRKGFEVAEIVVIVQNVPAEITALKIQESDDGSTFADIAGTVIGTAEDIDGNTTVLPTATYGDDMLFVFQIDLNKRKRYLAVIVTAGDGSGQYTEVTAIARLSRGNIGITDSASAGADHVVRV